MSTKPLGRRVPEDWKHVERYPFSAVAPVTVSTVNKILRLPDWHWTHHNQGREGSCVGWGSSMMMSLLNHRRYDAVWLWNRAKEVDDWPETNPGDNQGTSVRASGQILRDQGHRRMLRGVVMPASRSEGISAYRWASTVDEMRSALSLGVPISIGVNWYSGFDTPVLKGRHYWIGQGDIGYVRGGHCVCIYGASDTRQAFRVKNSWGRAYPLCWLPYATMQRLLDENGEAMLSTDR